MYLCKWQDRWREKTTGIRPAKPPARLATKPRCNSYWWEILMIHIFDFVPSPIIIYLMLKYIICPFNKLDACMCLYGVMSDKEGRVHEQGLWSYQRGRQPSCGEEGWVDEQSQRCIRVNKGQLYGPSCSDLCHWAEGPSIHLATTGTN